MRLFHHIERFQGNTVLLLVSLTLALAACSKQNNPDQKGTPPPKRAAFKRPVDGGLGVLVPKHDSTKPASPKHADAGVDIFADGNIPRMQIAIPRAGMATLRQYNWSGDERVPVRCTVKEGATIYTNVAVHLKGAAGSFQSVDDNPCLTLNFDKFAKGQRFHGLQKISLNNSVQDRTYLAEKICREMFDAAGVPVPRAGHAKVQLNGRNLGLYVMTEGFNKQFLKRYFENPNGNLYDGGFCKDITQGLEKTSGENPNDQSDLRALAAAAMETDPAKRLARLDKVLDLDRFITFIALDVMIWDWDGYPMKPNNYRIYHDPDSDRLVFMPHGLDQMFWRPDGSISPPMNGLVARAVLQLPGGKRRYLDRMSQLLTNVLHVDAITNRIHELAAQIQPVLGEGHLFAVSQHKQQVAVLCERIAQRARTIQQRVGTPAKPLKFDASGIAPLTEWRPKIDRGTPVVSRTKDRSGKTLLYIRAGSGQTVASWRTQVMLEPGRFRFEGRLKTQGVALNEAEQRRGVGLRISSQRITQRIPGTTDWTTATFDIDASEGSMEVELVCELTAMQGEVWFDLDSLKLVRQ